jgi:hypothetical protein
MLPRVAVVRTDDSEERSASIIRVTTICELGTLAVTTKRWRCEEILLNNIKEYLEFLRSVRRLLVTANVVPSLPILVTLMIEALSSSETSVRTRSTRHKILLDYITSQPIRCYRFCIITQDLRLETMTWELTFEAPCSPTAGLEHRYWSEVEGRGLATATSKPHVIVVLSRLVAPFFNEHCNRKTSAFKQAGEVIAASNGLKEALQGL